MSSAIAVLALLLIAAVLWDAFETIVLPRRVARRLRIARLFTRAVWWFWAGVARRLPDRDGLREAFLGVYGPGSVLGLVLLWASGLIFGYGLLLLGMRAPMTSAEDGADFLTLLYLSGTTFFTLGPGDVVPQPGPARLVMVLESATGFAFLGLIISYIPALFTTFTQREVAITLLDARAGSPPSTVALLRRHGRWGQGEPLATLLREWETWAADLLNGYLSYPLLAFFRSQHEGQSWLAALTVLLDTCALLIVGISESGRLLQSEQARLTFAIARHAVGDLTQVFDAAPRPPASDRLPPAELERLRALLSERGLALREGPTADTQLVGLRALYEPYVAALAALLLLPVPPWIPRADAVDDWETTAWQYDPAPVRQAFGRDS